MASIQVIQGPDKGRKFNVPEDRAVIGRTSRTVQLSDSTVSREHSQLVYRNREWFLEDLGSANGTYLNGVRIGKSAPLNLGDQVRCGSTLLVFGGGPPIAAIDVDENGQIVDAAIVATIPSSADSVIIPTPEAGAEAIGNLRILYDLIRETSSLFDVDLLLERTLAKVFEVVKADRGYIMLIDADGKLSLKCSRRVSEAPDDEAPISRTIINEVVGKEIGVLSSNAMSDKRFTAGKSVHNFGIRSALCAPIKGHDRVLGVIHVDCSVSQHTYSTEQLRLLTAIGYQAGLAVENVRLYESAVRSEKLAAVGETVAFLSHHIKNILQALGGGLDIVEMGLRRSDLKKVNDAWPIVQRNLGRINDLILNMLAFSKRRKPLRQSVNVNRVLDECIDLLSGRADERGVVILADLDEMPPIPADLAGLRQAFMNLLTNALDAIENQTGAITVSSTFDTMNRAARVSVRDNGTGIAPDVMKDIFTPFYSNKGQKGTGLGLAVTKKIVEEHHGRIDVDSKPGEGTTFTVHLPAVEHEGADAFETDHSGNLR